MNLRLILVPYDSGHREWRMGKGPAHLLRHGIASHVRAGGHTVSAEVIDHDHHTPSDVASSFALYRVVADRVRRATQANELPVLLGGNCGVTIGAAAGLGDDLAVVWLDAHGDFNTPETTRSGFLDGMSLSILTGRCWRAMAESIPDFSPVPEAHAVLLGVRSIDDGEERELASAGVRVVRAIDMRVDGVVASLGEPIDALAKLTHRVHLHIDLDVLDPTAVGRANEFAVDGGLTLSHLDDTIRLLASRFAIAGVTLSAYDPDCDLTGGIFRAATHALSVIAEEAQMAQSAPRS